MVKPEWGAKRNCPKCGERTLGHPRYDHEKDVIRQYCMNCDSHVEQVPVDRQPSREAQGLLDSLAFWRRWGRV